MTATAPAAAITDEDRLRADLYDFLGALLARPPSKELIARCASLTGDTTDLGEACNAFARVAGALRPKAVEGEYNRLFIGLGRGELLPYASYYMTGFLNEKPLATLRTDMARARIARSSNVFEPEDNIASLMEMMAGMITGRFGTPAPLDRQREFFARHISPWAAHFFSDLEGAENSVFYAPVGAIGRAFMEIETEAFRMGDSAAPTRT
ncbi:MAG: molecular chaperone TorD family protein [Pseudomonadota bacterium]